MIDIYTVAIISAIGGMLVAFFVQYKDEVPIKKYEQILYKYDMLCIKLHKPPYIGATYTNGYLDIIVLNFDKDTVWYVSDKNPINYLDRELFTDQFILKEE